jgi:hypothetical protein
MPIWDSINMFDKIEQGLLSLGQVQNAARVQKLARLFESPADKRKQNDWIIEFLDCESKIHSILQDEEMMRYMSENYEKHGYKFNEEGANEYLCDLDKEWWQCIQKRYEYLFAKPKGSQIRYFDLYVNGYLPYTQEKVQKACKARGGCCAFDCGCCYKERKTHRMKQVFAHCSNECVCCVLRRDLNHHRADSEESDVGKRARHILACDSLRVNTILT